MSIIFRDLHYHDENKERVLKYIFSSIYTRFNQAYTLLCIPEKNAVTFMNNESGNCMKIIINDTGIKKQKLRDYDYVILEDYIIKITDIPVKEDAIISSVSAEIASYCYNYVQ